MNKTFAIAAMALLAVGGASAQVQVKPVVGAGLTFGGDTIATVYFEDDDLDDAKVHAGGLLALHGGVELRFTDQVSMQALVGYHVDQVNASNADVRWDRTPIEFLGHYRLTSWFRLGGGARYTPNARLRASGVASNDIPNIDFKPTWGSVVEGEFFPYHSIGIKLRYVNEKFKPKNIPGGQTLDGSHGGIYVNYYFF
ncbi:MAG TPA: outer membrane beta-barrel protein [Rhizobacter sp.]